MWRKREVSTALVCLAVGSVGQLVQFLVSPVSSAGTAADNVAAAAAAPGRMEAAAWLDLTILFFVPVVVLLGYFAGARTTKLGWVATLIAVATTLPGVAYVLAPDPMYLAGIPASGIQAYTEQGVVSASTLLFLVGHVLGLVLLGIALWRAGRLPRWAGVCLALYPFAEIGGTAAGVRPVTVVGYLLLTATCAAGAAALVRTAGDRTAQVSAPDVAAVPSSGH
ncbi:hypothetical protein [Cryptosporangium sp. NPDC051539]|uniref:hypothetical protein n=1 Tax=Cryptosporangium sp. NPDC051539 TaxID=3363962 RepID=UPI0037B1CFD2